MYLPIKMGIFYHTCFCQKNKNLPQILAVFSGSLVAVLSGILHAWPSAFIINVTKDENYHMSSLTAMHSCGMVLMSPFFVQRTNIIGKKKTILIGAVPLTAALIIKSFTAQLWSLHVAKILTGVGDALVYSSLPAYIGEITTPEVRGSWGNVMVCAWIFGQFLVSLVGNYCTVKVTCYVLIIIPILFLLSFRNMPESPYYYIMLGKVQEAKESILKLNLNPNPENEFKNIQSAVEKDLQQCTGNWGDLINSKANKIALTTGIFLRVSQPLCGLIILTCYPQIYVEVFQKSGGYITVETSAVLQTGITLYIYACASLLPNVVGRKKCYIVSAALSAIVLFGEATYFYINPKTTSIFTSLLPLVGLCAHVVVSSFGVGLIPSLMLTEIFSTNIKGYGLRIIIKAYALANVLSLYSFHYLNSALGLYAPLFLFASFNIASAVIGYFIVPETTGKSLAVIQKMLKTK